MAVTVFPAPAAGGGVKSVQRGLAGAAGTVTITAVDTSKSFVTVYGTATSGVIAPAGTLEAGSWNAINTNSGTARFTTGGTYYTGAGSISARSITAGTNTLVSAVVQGYLSNSTSLVVSNACRWEVVEFA
jgi:hypothetical protein